MCFGKKLSWSNLLFWLSKFDRSFASVYYVSTVRITGRLACGIPGGGEKPPKPLLLELFAMLLSFLSQKRGIFFWPLYTYKIVLWREV